MSDWHNIHITDKSGKVFFKVCASPLSTFSEIRNLKHHIDAARNYPDHYKFMDAGSAYIVLDDEPYAEPTADDLDAILDELI